jgi:ABC-type multidrug transport system fused ATPase/permease subunit
MTGLIEVIPWMAMLEQEMNSIERVRRYATLEQEAASVLPSDTDLDAWPSVGAITFSDVQLKYRPELPLVLKGLSFEVRPGEKVGILGRTGAGKSSLVQAVYRTVELAGGSISVDGVDLRNVGLQTVRCGRICLALACDRY